MWKNRRKTKKQKTDILRSIGISLESVLEKKRKANGKKDLHKKKVLSLE